MGTSSTDKTTQTNPVTTNSDAKATETAFNGSAEAAKHQEMLYNFYGLVDCNGDRSFSVYDLIMGAGNSDSNKDGKIDFFDELISDEFRKFFKS